MRFETAMTAPTPYVPSYDFTDWQTANPTVPLPADQVDIQFAALALTTSQIIINLGLIQRSDGALANQVVTLDSLSPDVIDLIGQWNPRGAWLTATAYSKLDLVTQGGFRYVATAAHTSGVFATDLAANKWMLLGNGVQSFEGRTGAVVSAAGDYAASEITNDSSVSGATVKLALEGLVTSLTVPATSETVAGKIELLTQTELDTATDDVRAPTALKTGRLLKQGTAIASATNIAKPADADRGGRYHITGTTTIATFWATSGFPWPQTFIFDGVLTLTNSASLICIGGQDIKTAAGDVAVLVPEAGDIWRMVSYVRKDGTALVSTAEVVASASNLVAAQTGNATTSITADEFTVKDASGRAITLSTVSLTPNIGSSGANGLDTGAEAANTWYHQWVIYNPTTGGVAGLISLSATAPTLPSGYTYKGYVGPVRNDGSSNFVYFYQVGRQVWIRVTATSVASTAAGAINTYQSLSLSSIVPPNARTVLGRCGSTNTVAETSIMVAGDNAGLGAQGHNADGATTVIDTFAGFANFEVPMPTAQTIYWKSAVNTATSSIDVSGYRI